MEFNYILCIITASLALIQLGLVWLMGGVAFGHQAGALICPTIFSSAFKYNITDKAWDKGLEIKRGPHNQSVLKASECRRSDYSRYTPWNGLFFFVIIGLIPIIYKLYELITKDHGSSEDPGYKTSDLILAGVTTVSFIISLITGGMLAALISVFNIVSVISIAESIYF